MLNKPMPTDPIRVLLVDDDPDDCLLTEHLFREIGLDRYTVVCATSYDGAVALLAEAAFDVCLFDHNLGPRTGMELLRELRGHGVQTPIILLTGHSDHRLDLEATLAGASDYMVKDRLQSDTLERSIRYAMAQHQMAEERLRFAREQETRESANRAKDEFLAVVSHELRSPLNAILGWSRLLRTSAPDAETMDRGLEIIERSASSQARLIDDLLDVSRIISGNLRLNTMEVEPGILVAAAVDAALPLAQAKKIQLSSDVNGGVGLVAVDPDRLQQVVANLLSNSIKFTPPGGTIHIRLDRENGAARLAVTDTGRGIPPEFLPRIFDRYQQAAGVRDSTQTGLGLGLAIVRHLVEMHGGTVSAASAGDGQGSTFQVKLPLVPVPQIGEPLS
jgi:signal transduction histidine kinase